MEPRLKTRYSILCGWLCLHSTQDRTLPLYWRRQTQLKFTESRAQCACTKLPRVIRLHIKCKMVQTQAISAFKILSTFSCFGGKLRMGAGMPAI